MVDLPQGWCECVLGDICRLDNGIKVANINIPLLDARYLRGKKEPEYRNQGVVLNPDEYVILVDGENSGEVFSIQEKGIMGSTFKKLDVSKKSSAKYALYFIRSHQALFRTNKKGAAIPHLDKYLFKSLRFTLPPLAEQERIVEKIEELFSDIDDGVKNLKNAQLQVKRYRQSVLKAAFEGELHKTSNWVEYNMGKVCLKIQDGSHFSPKVKYNEPGNGLYPYITAKNIRMNYMDLSNVQYVDAKFHNSIYLRCDSKKGDILLTKDGVNTGDIAINIINAPISLLSSVCLIRGNEKICKNKFILYYMQSPKGRKLLIGDMTGTAIKRIILQKIKQLPIKVPTILEQQKIVEEIEKRFAVADELEKAINDGLANAERLKQSILKKAFSGKLMPQNPSDEPASELLKRIKAEKDIQVKNKKGRKQDERN